MSRNQKIRQQGKLKTSLRLAVIATAASVAGLVLLLIVVFNMTQQEEGRAAQSAMSFKNAETIQDTSAILRGSTNQRVIGVMVETSGKGSPVKMSEMTFSAHGTSIPVAQNIENARLWYTGNDPNFVPSQQVGATIARVTEVKFDVNCDQELVPGKNYFWLTVDVKSEALTGPGSVDATCEEFRIGAISYKPSISDPAGKRYTEPNIAYYSMGSYAVNNLSAWNSKRDGTGLPPKQLHANRNSYFIQAGHRMISSTGSSLQTLVVERGGELRITAPLRLNTMYVAFGGVVEQDITVSDYYCFNEFIMDNGSNYIHNNTGYVPGLHCRFDAHSNQTFFQYGQATFTDNVAWGNVVIDATTPLDIDVKQYFKNVQGDLEIRRTGLANNGLFVGGCDTMRIGGSLIMSGGNFKGISSSQSASLNIHVGQNFILKGGSFQDADLLKNKGTTEMTVGGDMMLLVGRFNFSRGVQSCINFGGKGTSRWMQKPEADVLLGNVSINNNREVIIKGDKMGAVAAGCKIEVAKTGSLLCENAIVNGDGEFVLDDQATLGIGHQDGICSAEAKGNIQTSTRLFNSGGIYMYYTLSQPQQTGIFVTTPEPNAVRCLVLNKDRSGMKVNLSNDLKVTEKVMITKGDLREGEHDLIMPRMSAKN
jgi:hypothetical protein